MRFEYLTHALPLDAGPDGLATRALGELAAQGWRVAAAFPAPALSGPALDPASRPTACLYVVLERPAQ